MNWYKANLRLRSWVASEWQADIIFGHLCWGMIYLYGEDKLSAFLSECKQGRPPLLVSNGFPGDLLPVPMTKPAVFDRSAQIAEQKKKYAEIKQQRSVRYASLDEFNACLSGQPPDRIAEQPVNEFRRIALKNQLDRNTGTTTPGGVLFNFEEIHMPAVSIYFKVTDGFEPVLEKLLNYLKDTGYGKRKSVGYGSIDSLSFNRFNGFKSPHQANGFVTLSNFMPAADDPVKGRYAVITKYGRMGEAYSSEDHAFKKPLLMMAAGSTFTVAKSRDYYGRMVEGISYYRDTLHYAYALPVPMITA